MLLAFRRSDPAPPTSRRSRTKLPMLSVTPWWASGCNSSEPPPKLNSANLGETLRNRLERLVALVSRNRAAAHVVLAVVDKILSDFGA